MTIQQPSKFYMTSCKVCNHELVIAHVGMERRAYSIKRSGAQGRLVGITKEYADHPIVKCGCKVCPVWFNEHTRKIESTNPSIVLSAVVDFCYM